MSAAACWARLGHVFCCNAAALQRAVSSAVDEADDKPQTTIAAPTSRLSALGGGRLCMMKQWRHSTGSSHATTATQTDPIDDSDDDDDAQAPLLLVDGCEERRLMSELEMAADGYIDDTDIEERCRQLQCVEYEEVALERADCETRVGLTLCYGSGDDVETDIFVSEVDPNGIAHRSGRVNVGDQILQIDGVDVHTRNQAMQLFRSAAARVTLLLARSVSAPPDDGQTEPLTLDETALSVDTPLPPPPLSPMPECCEEDAGALTDATRDSAGKDSGISRATDSEPEMAPLPPPLRSPSDLSSADSCQSPCERGGGFFGALDDADAGLQRSSTTITGTPLAEQATRKWSLTSGTTPPAPTSSALSSPGSEAPPPVVVARRPDSDGDLERELACLHREMETIRFECDRLIAKHATAELHVRQQVEQAHTLIHTMDDMAQRRVAAVAADSSASTPQRVCKGKLDDTSSAYNTGGESCRSTPLAMHYPPLIEVVDPQLLQRGVYCQNRRKVAPSAAGVLPRRAQVNSLPQRAAPAPPSKGQLPPQPPQSSTAEAYQAGDVMYTTPENLQRTIVLQQRLMRQAMIQQAAQLKSQNALSNGPARSSSLYEALSQQNSEWKVKRRSDGSRYIVKRPVRAKLLKDRAQQLKNERIGTSTDDDARSELKIGRFWSREERKQHMERARERKLRQQELLRQKMTILSNASDAAILQLSHKKMQRRKGQQLFDKFTTIQEFLAHGNRGSSKTMGILSVTTV